MGDSSGNCVVGKCPSDSFGQCNYDGICEYGEETCCGETFASMQCECMDGQSLCRYTEACRGRDCDNDDDDDDNEDKCPFDMNDKRDYKGTCEYGTETCCGETFASMECQCMDGQSLCHFTEACRGRECDNDDDDDKKGRCPTYDSSPWGGHECNFAGQCRYGEEACCGKVFAELVCQ